jgi:hypothetical protein
MARETLLRRVAVTEVALVIASSLFLRLASRPLDGLLLGAGIGGFSFLTFWALARTLVAPSRRGLAYALGTAKILLYFVITAAVLTGHLVVDPLGFAVGVSCFVFATIGVALAGSAAGPQLDHRYGSV